MEVSAIVVRGAGAESGASTVACCGSIIFVSFEREAHAARPRADTQRRRAVLFRGRRASLVMPVPVSTSVTRTSIPREYSERRASFVSWVGCPIQLRKLIGFPQKCLTLITGPWPAGVVAEWRREREQRPEDVEMT
jgi:hypothetical protein